MMELDCEFFVGKGDLAGLVDWLNDKEANVDCFIRFLSSKVHKSAEFICEHTYFVYTGRVKRSFKLFKDEDMNLVASTLGSTSVYSDGRSGQLKDEFVEVKRYRRPDDFMKIYSQCCKEVDGNLAFSSIMQIIKCSGDDFGELLEILAGIIEGLEKGRSSLITTSLISALGYLEENKRIEILPVLKFLELLWNTKDEDDTHGVGRSSLRDFTVNLIVKLKLGVVKVVESEISAGESCSMLGDLVCKNQKSVYNWVCGLSLRRSDPVSGSLDNFPPNDAVCIYLLLESNRSLIPRVYSLKCMGQMAFKISHVFLSNLAQESSKQLLSNMAIESAEMGIQYIEAAELLEGVKVIDDPHMFPWNTVGYLSKLLNEGDVELDNNRVANIFKSVLDLSSLDVRHHLLKSVMKSVENEFGRSLCLMQCKDVSINWPVCEEGMDLQGKHTRFFKCVLDSYFELPIITTLEDSMYDSLSVLLNWIKYLLLSKNRLIFKKIVKCEYLESLHKLYSRLIEKASCSHTSHISAIFLNKLELIKFLISDLFALVDKDD